MRRERKAGAKHEESAIIFDAAKTVLIKQMKMSEEQAQAFLLRQAMNRRITKLQAAEVILRVCSEN